MTIIKSRVGQIVLYTLSEYDAAEIGKKRQAAGTATASGNPAREGTEYPALIITDHAGPFVDVREQAIDYVSRWYPEASKAERDQRVDEFERNYIRSKKGASVNLQVFLDGNDVYWATSRSAYDPETNTDVRGHFRANPEPVAGVVEYLDGTVSEGVLEVDERAAGIVRAAYAIIETGGSVQLGDIKITRVDTNGDPA